MKQAPPTHLAWWVAGLFAAGAAQGQGQAPPPSLADLDLEQLSSIQVTSVGKRVQRLADVAGSVYVISQEDIRRSGALTLPEVLRLASNLQVARADANQYAITARGFNSVLANKILVLVDGRTVYSPLFSGVFWEAQDLVLNDIERIEILSGAGGTLYGSNAVNGVINIITRNAGETTGLLLKGAGGAHESLLAARVGGGSADGTPWRLYAKRATTEATRLESGLSTDDAGERVVAGFRLDQARERDQLTLQGDLLDARFDQPAGARRVSGANLLGRWARDHGGGGRTQVQAWFDRAERRQPGSIDDTMDTWDVEVQQASRPAQAHELLLGAGYRLEHDRLENIAPASLVVLPTERWLHLWNVFAQDEVRLAPALHLTAGLKAEHNSYSGLEWLPNLRLAWQPLPDHLLWASASRAVRTPARVDRDVSVPGLLQSNPAFASEVAQVFEVGWRGQPRSSVSYSFTVFHHQFERLRSVDLLPTSLLFGNNYHGRLTGIETWGNWRLAPQWRLQAGYTWQRLRLGAEPGSAATPASAAQLGNDPRSRGQLGLAWDLAHNMELDLQVRHVGALPDPLVPAYTALDVRWAWRVRPGLELSLSGRNMADPWHPEWGAAGTRAEIPRSVVLKAVWRL
jgi:iron complex outermembrane receptor protein